MRIKVNSYSGYKAEERPISFCIGEKELKIEELVDRWYGEDYEYFKLRADDRCIYIIRYNRNEDFWELVMMEGGKV